MVAFPNLAKAQKIFFLHRLTTGEGWVAFYKVMVSLLPPRDLRQKGGYEHLNRIWTSSALFFSYVGKRRQPFLGPRDVGGEKRGRGQEGGGASKRCISRYSGPGLQSWFNIVPLILKFAKPQLAPHGLQSVYFMMNLLWNKVSSKNVARY